MRYSTEFVPVEELEAGNRLPVRDGRGKRIKGREHVVIKVTRGERMVELVTKRESSGDLFPHRFSAGRKFEREV